jgi:RecA-family ATPase
MQATAYSAERSNGLGKIKTINQGSIAEDAKELLNQAANDNHCSSIEITGNDLLTMNVEQMDCLVDPLLPKVGLVALAGQSDIGKSMLLRQMAFECVINQTFLGFPIKSKHGSSIFVSSEDDSNATAYLLKRQLGESAKGMDLGGLRFIFESFDIIKHLHKSLLTKPADLVVIDCFQDNYGGDLKDTQKIRTFLHQFQELAILHQCLIIFLHHTGKRTEGFEPSKNNLLSGQGFEAKMRLVMELRSDQSNPNARHLCIVKGNYLPTRYKKESFVLQFNEETFTFSNTGERVPFELLAKQNEDGSKLKYQQAKELKDLNYTYEQIAERLGYESKGSITKLFQKAEKNGWNK